MAGLALLLAACGATATKTLPPALDAQSNWPGLFGDVVLDADQLDFRHRMLVTGIDGTPLQDGALREATAHCEEHNCRVSPGPHQVTIDYEWSSAKSLGDERSENLLSMLLLGALLMGGGSGGGDYSADPGMLRCSVTLNVPFAAGRRYRLSVSHSNQRLAPETLGVIDVESGESVATTDACQAHT